MKSANYNYLSLLLFSGLLSCGQCINATSTSPTEAPKTGSPSIAPTKAVSIASAATLAPTVSSTTAFPTTSSITDAPSSVQASPVAATTATTFGPTTVFVNKTITGPSTAPVAGGTLSPSSAQTPSSTSVAPTALGTGPTPSPSGVTNFPTVTSAVSYFTKPKVKWSIQLSKAGPGLAQLGSGNAVTVSPDGGLIYVTLSDGTLEARKASNGELAWTYTPPANEFNSEIQCSSGVTFGNFQAIGDYVVYAIIDSPPSGTNNDFTSRVVAVSHPAGNPLWVSSQLPGVIEGAPGITKSASGPENYIIVTHNLNTTTADASGVFSVLQANDNITLLFSEYNSVAYPNESYKYSYGPLGVAKAPLSGNYPGGEGNTNDVFIWTTSRKAGKSNKGFTFAFQLPSIFQASLVRYLNSTRLNPVRWSAVARPTLSDDGQNLFVGVSHAELRAWTKNTNFQKIAKWKQSLAVSSTDPDTPVLNAPILSTDETRLYTSSPSPNLYGLQAVNGRILWTANLTSVVSSEVKVSPDDVYVYAIQQSGEVSAFDQLTGEIAWTITCADFVNVTASCRNGTTAEFSLSPSLGLVLYYGDYLGNVKALQLGTSLAPTVTPSDYPTAVPVTAAPVTSAPTSAAPQSPPTAAPTTTAPSAPPKVSDSPSQAPSVTPSQQLLVNATPAPSSLSPLEPPSSPPTTLPPTTLPPTSLPPTTLPTFKPTSKAPTRAPTLLRSEVPSDAPSLVPVRRPTRKPSTPAPRSSPAAARGSFYQFLGVTTVSSFLAMAIPIFVALVL